MNLIRNLIGMIITVTMLPICITSFIYTSNIKFDYNEINDELALSQLREELLIAYDMDVSSSNINFRYKNKNFKLSYVNGKLLLQPGTQIYLNNIDSLYFRKKNGCVYVCYRKGSKEYERILCKEEGLYINDFSDCDVLFDECDSCQE